MANAQIERQGIVQDELTGETFIPASQRPDGSWRKPRRVKEGYIPQEEMPTYENKGVQWMKSRSNLPPGMNPQEAEKSQKNQTVPGQPLSKAAKKNQKKKEKKKQQQQQEEDHSSRVEKVTFSLADSKITSDQSDSKNSTISQSGPSCNATDKEEVMKKIKSLRKKLKQIEDLETKINSGELKNPEKEQLEKVSRKQTVIDEINELESKL